MFTELSVNHSNDILTQGHGNYFEVGGDVSLGPR